MPEVFQPHTRESTKANFERDFGEMLELEDAQKRLGKNGDIIALYEEGKIIGLWPGNNRPVFPAFQFLEDEIRPQVAEVLNEVNNSSNHAFYSPRMLCEWFVRPTGNAEGQTPISFMDNAENERLLEEARKFGEALLPKNFH